VKVPGRLFGSLFFPRKRAFPFGLLTEARRPICRKPTPSIPPGPPRKPSALLQLPTVISEVPPAWPRRGPCIPKTAEKPPQADSRRRGFVRACPRTGISPRELASAMRFGRIGQGMGLGLKHYL
jgi:hypothetical protein